MENMQIKISAEMMSPFSNHYQYVQHIVLNNLWAFKCSFKEDKDNIRRNSCLFFNAVVSVNHIPDYMFWEWEEDLKKIGIKKESVFYAHLVKTEEFSFMKDIRDVANAAKHCCSKMKARDISKNLLGMNVELIPDENNEFVKGFKISSDISTESYYEKNYAVIERAWQFWVNYHPDKYKEKIFENAQIGGQTGDQKGGEKGSVKTTGKTTNKTTSKIEGVESR